MNFQNLRISTFSVFQIYLRFFSDFFQVFLVFFLKKNDVKIDQKMNQKSIQNYDFREKICKEMLQTPPGPGKATPVRGVQAQWYMEPYLRNHFVITKELLKLRKIIT